MIQQKSLIAAVAALCVAGSCQAGRLGVFTSGDNGFDTHTFYYDDGQEVTVVDTQFVPELTKAMVEQIRKETKSPITRVIVTHPNPDKFNGLSYLHSIGAKSVGSAATARAMPEVHKYKKNFFVNAAKMFTESSYPQFENIQQTFTGKEVIKLKSGETLTLVELKNPGVTSDQVVVRIDSTGDLLVGDLISHNAHAWLEGAIVNGKPHTNLEQWRAALLELPPLSASKPQAKAYGGRGDFVTVKQAVDDQRKYLEQANSIVDSYIQSVADKRALVDPATASGHAEGITKKMSEAFPTYSAPYLVRYSVYGLIHTKLE
ncbi:MAG TPA: MBL fold metallo-hydrolase [Burkholderiaceae bacterium]|nr:MBL fold metallo-hydrolase [Burkholderiaceae bacterium]